MVLNLVRVSPNDVFGRQHAELRMLNRRLQTYLLRDRNPGRDRGLVNNKTDSRRKGVVLADLRQGILVPAWNTGRGIYRRCQKALGTYPQDVYQVPEVTVR